MLNALFLYKGVSCVKRIAFFSLIFFSFILYVCFTQDNSYAHLFKKIEAPFVNEKIVGNPQEILKSAQSTLRFIVTHEKKAWAPFTSPIFAQFGITLDDVKRTLRFIIETIKQDRSKKKQRILDPHFINKHFNVICWTSEHHEKNQHSATNNCSDVRLTYYLIYRVNGSFKKTKDYPYALYAVPDEEKKLTDHQIEQKKKSLIRYSYTKQDIINGVLLNKKVRPLVWLSRQGLEEALQQGTVIVVMPDGSERTFNVDKCNDIPYDHALENRELQKRYWYFKATEGHAGYNGKIDSIPDVTLAGDVYNLGLGKIVALKYTNKQTELPELKLGVLSDTGGAFKNNLHQLDCFTGIFSSPEEFKAHIKNLPMSAQAYILIKK